MTSYDGHSDHDSHSQDLPTMTLAEPTTAPTDRQADAPTAPVDDFEQNQSADPSRAHPTNPEVEPSSESALFADDELAGLRARWDAVQAAFVDDPRECVQKADGLVSDVVSQLATGFTQARSRLEQHWGRGEEASTEDLRVALTRYRDFFERLLAV